MWFKFWIKSSRGTDTFEHRWIPKEKGVDHKAEVKDQLDYWIKSWDHLEYFNYGYLRQKPPPAVQKKMIDQAADRLKYAREHLSFLKSQFEKGKKK